MAEVCSIRQTTFGHSDESAAAGFPTNAAVAAPTPSRQRGSKSRGGRGVVGVWFKDDCYVLIRDPVFEVEDHEAEAKVQTILREETLLAGEQP